MSEEKEEIKEVAPDPELDKKKNPFLMIELMEDGYNIKVGGIIMDERIAFFLLEKAKDVIKAYNLRQRQPNIVQPKGGIMNFARRRN